MTTKKKKKNVKDKDNDKARRMTGIRQGSTTKEKLYDKKGKYNSLSILFEKGFPSIIRTTLER